MCASGYLKKLNNIHCLVYSSSSYTKIIEPVSVGTVIMNKWTSLELTFSNGWSFICEVMELKGFLKCYSDAVFVCMIGRVTIYYQFFSNNFKGFQMEKRFCYHSSLLENCPTSPTLCHDKKYSSAYKTFFRCINVYESQSWICKWCGLRVKANDCFQALDEKYTFILGQTF